MTIQACPICASSFDPLQGKYSPDGSVVCAPCGERLAQLSATAKKKSAGSAFVGACGAVLIALLSFVMQLKLVFFGMPLMAMLFGGGTAYTAITHPEAREMLGWKRIPTVVIGAFAVLLALLSLIVRLL